MEGLLRGSAPIPLALRLLHARRGMTVASVRRQCRDRLMDLMIAQMTFQEDQRQRREAAGGEEGSSDCQAASGSGGCCGSNSACGKKKGGAAAADAPPAGAAHSFRFNVTGSPPYAMLQYVGGSGGGAAGRRGDQLPTVSSADFVKGGPAIRLTLVDEGGKFVKKDGDYAVVDVSESAATKLGGEAGVALLRETGRIATTLFLALGGTTMNAVVSSKTAKETGKRFTSYLG